MFYYIFLFIFCVFIAMKLLYLILFKAPRTISGCECYRIVLLLLLLSLLVNPFSHQCIKASLTPFDEMMRHSKIIRRGVDFRPLPFRHLMIFGQGHNHDVIRLFKHVKITECIWNTCVLCI